MFKKWHELPMSIIQSLSLAGVQVVLSLGICHTSLRHHWTAQDILWSQPCGHLGVGQICAARSWFSSTTHWCISRLPEVLALVFHDLGEYLLMFSRRCFNFSCWWWWFQCILSYLVTNRMKNERSMSPLNFLLVDHHLASPIDGLHATMVNHQKWPRQGNVKSLLESFLTKRPIWNGCFTHAGWVLLRITVDWGYNGGETNNTFNQPGWQAISWGLHHHV